MRSVPRPPRAATFLMLAGLALDAVPAARADPAPFDLAGPVLTVKVTRGTVTLPIAQVPNLAPGDRLSVRADMPASQTAHYLLITAFLRGATNPPPKEWFHPCQTWTPKCARDGLTVTVPADAQQMLIFLAPETGGDFRTVVGAVRGRPGAFVRTSQDLNQASLDRQRLESYLAGVRAINESDPARLKEAAPLLARSLAIRVQDPCLDKPLSQVAPCLLQGQNSLILNDGHSTSIVEALTSGPASDLAMEASFTPQLSYGYYSPYIASVLDIARIMDSFRTALYQYIPALTAAQGERLALTLNTPPSFHDPKSVLVMALPAIEREQLPPLHAVDAKQSYCARKAALVLPVEGAPLVFSTEFAHDLALRITAADGSTVALPVKADAQRGGLTVDTSPLEHVKLAERVQASVQGYWGFDAYSTPPFVFDNPHVQTWVLAGGDADSLIAGRDKSIRLQSGSASCLDSIRLKSAAGPDAEIAWKPVKADEVEAMLSLKDMRPGAFTLLVHQHGAPQPQALELRTFAEAARLDGFAMFAGDAQGLLRGARLDEVAGMTISGVEFVPGRLETTQGIDELSMVTRDAQPAVTLKAGDTAKARVSLKDGRQVDLPTTIGAPRPRVALLAKSVQLAASGGPSHIELSGGDELPQDARLTFSVRAQPPTAFNRDSRVEIATADESATTTLSVGNGSMLLEDSRVAVITLDPRKAFGTSVFGPLLFRTVVNGVAGEWQPLATLVRLPLLQELKCPATVELACKLSGSGLFLIAAVAGNPQFEHSVQVPDGFPGDALPVPHPADGTLYVRLRDDPGVISRATLSAQQLPASAEEATRADVRRAAAHPEVSGGATGGTTGDNQQAAPPERPAERAAATDHPSEQ